jgi:hypothetical protein
MAIDNLIEAAKNLKEEQITMLVNFAKFLESQNKPEIAGDSELDQLSDMLIEQNREAYEELAK